MALTTRLERMKFYKMTDYCRPEVDTDVMSYQMIEGIEVVLETKFDCPSSNRLGAIQIAHFVTTTMTWRVTLHPNQLRWLGRKKQEKIQSYQ
jgi:hypothetical protein